MTPRQRFAEEYGIEFQEVVRFTVLGIRRARFSEYAMNGDPHPQSHFFPREHKDTQDKNKNARLWEEEVDKLGEKMTELAIKWGFHHLDFGVGLYPTLQKNESDCGGSVHFPWD